MNAAFQLSESLFSPDEVDSIRCKAEDYKVALGESMDLRSGAVYVYSKESRDAVKVALAIGRPLLVYGNPGVGKSSLAPAVARHLGFRYYEAVVTSRTQARDLMWTFDAVARLADADAGLHDRAIDQHRYIQPASLWWAFDPASAVRRGRAHDDSMPPVDPGVYLPGSPADRSERSVVLIDEIDKADPDLPNDLLIALGGLSFRVTEIDFTVVGKREAPPLIIITTNEERDLPSAFLRRCVQVRLPTPRDTESLAQIARAHFGPDHERVYTAVAEAIQVIRTTQLKRGQRQSSTAEYLDAVRACLLIEGARPPDGPLWAAVMTALLDKSAAERPK